MDKWHERFLVPSLTSGTVRIGDKDFDINPNLNLKQIYTHVERQVKDTIEPKLPSPYSKHKNNIQDKDYWNNKIQAFGTNEREEPRHFRFRSP